MVRGTILSFLGAMVEQVSGDGIAGGRDWFSSHIWALIAIAVSVICFVVVWATSGKYSLDKLRNISFWAGVIFFVAGVIGVVH